MATFDDDDRKGGMFAWLTGSTLWALIFAALLIVVVTLATVYSGIFSDEHDPDPVVSGETIETTTTTTVAEDDENTGDENTGDENTDDGDSEDGDAEG